MESERPTVSTSSDGSLLAVVTGGREVCIWETSSGKQLCRLSNPKWSSVLSIAWPQSKLIGTRKKRKRQSIHVESCQPSLIAVGTNSGLVVWDVARNEEHMIMPDDGCGGVVSASWGGADSIYVADGSREAFHWSIGKESLNRWKADKRGVSCICYHGDHDEYVLTAGKSIKLWDPVNQTLIKRFTGHASNVFSLRFITSSHFVSIANNDRYISLWNVDSGSNTSLVCENDVWSIHSTCERDKIKLVSICQDGVLHLFVLESHNHVKTSDPHLPVTTVQFAAQDTQSLKTPMPLPLIASHITNTSSDLLVAHTSNIRPVFEIIPFEQPQDRVCLVRTLPKGFLLPDEEDSAILDNNKQASTVVGLSTPRKLPWKQQEAEIDEKDVPMIYRLNLLSLDKNEVQTMASDENQSNEPVATTNQSADKTSQSNKPFATTESLTLLVVQAVHSEDKKMLEEIFNVRQERMIASTVRKLPVTAIVPFLKILIDLIHSRPTRAPQLTVWIRSLLLNHTAYLLTVPHLLDSLSTFYESLSTRTSLYGKLAKIQGKLDLVLAQAKRDDSTDDNEIDIMLKPFNVITAGEDLLFDDEDSVDENDLTGDVIFSSDNEEEEDVEEQDAQDEDKMDIC